MNQKVDAFLKSATRWRKEMSELRKIILDCGLAEDLKWGKPCYTFQDRNVIVVQPFKEYCALLFCKGALLKDPNKVLIQQTENVQAARQIRFRNFQEIVDQESVLKAYIKEAVDAERAGLEVQYKKTSEFKMPEEFQVKLDKNAKLKTAFNALTPGRQRGYLLYFSGAKQSTTREARVEKFIPRILKGKGLDD